MSTASSNNVGESTLQTTNKKPKTSHISQRRLSHKEVVEPEL